MSRVRINKPVYLTDSEIETAWEALRAMNDQYQKMLRFTMEEENAENILKNKIACKSAMGKLGLEMQRREQRKKEYGN